MKVPVPPPSFNEAMTDPDQVAALMKVMTSVDVRGQYRAWDTFRHLPPPDGLSVEQWWFATRLQRKTSARDLPLHDVDGHPFSYNLPDDLLRLSEDLARRAAGSVGIGEAVLTDHNRDRYLVSSLIDEAISSSQLEGASTSRLEARAMLESGREPRDKSETMIVNNFRAMSMLRNRLEEPVTPGLIFDIHKLVTEGTLENPADAGRLQQEDDTRVRVFGDGYQVLHTPPDASTLATRMTALCDFLNSSAPWVPPVLKALTAHFMMGYDHYFVDGNGRTARAVFYWVMLKEGFWLSEYIVVSQLLTEGPAKYARSFLLTEQDDGDLTHFLLFHLRIIERALDQLDKYLTRQIEQSRHIRARLHDTQHLNHRQIAIIEQLTDDPAHIFDSASIARINRVSAEASRQDLQGMEELGFLVRSKRGRKHIWSAAPRWESKLT